MAVENDNDDDDDDDDDDGDEDKDDCHRDGDFHRDDDSHRDNVSHRDAQLRLWSALVTLLPKIEAFDIFVGGGSGGSRCGVYDDICMAG